MENKDKKDNKTKKTDTEMLTTLYEDHIEEKKKQKLKEELKKSEKRVTTTFDKLVRFDSEADRDKVDELAEKYRLTHEDKKSSTSRYMKEMLLTDYKEIVYELNMKNAEKDAEIERLEKLRIKKNAEVRKLKEQLAQFKKPVTKAKTTKKKQDN